MKINSTVLLAALSLSALPFTGVAQDAPAAPPAPSAAATPAVDGGPGGAPNGGSGPRRGGDQREQFRQMMIERLKTALKASDEEMAVIQPLVEKVVTLQRQAGQSRFGGGGIPRPPRGGGDGAAPAAAGAPADRGPGRGGPRGGGSPEAQALQEALANDAAPAADIQAKLSALREQRKKAAGDLAAAREDLRKVLTARQEATLVLTGILE